eukprot:2477181-Pleurochrysis_carterae.AAC.2
MDGRCLVSGARSNISTPSRLSYLLLRRRSSVFLEGQEEQKRPVRCDSAANHTAQTLVLDTHSLNSAIIAQYLCCGDSCMGAVKLG